MKREHRYRITVEHLSDPKGNASAHEPLVFEAGNHDDILAIVKMVRERKLFEDDEITASFIVGQKLFGEVMLKDRKNPLFTEFWPNFLAFVKKMKAQIKGEGAEGQADKAEKSEAPSAHA